MNISISEKFSYSFFFLFWLYNQAAKGYFKLLNSVINYKQSFRKAFSSTLAKCLILRHFKSAEIKADFNENVLHRQSDANKECKEDSLHVA